MAIVRSYNQPVTAPTTQPVPVAPVMETPPEPVAPPIPMVTPVEEATVLSPAEAKAEEAPPQNRAWANGFTLEWNPDSLQVLPSPEKPDDAERMKRTTIIKLQGRGGSRVEIVVIPGGITEESEITTEERAAELPETPPEEAPSVG